MRQDFGFLLIIGMFVLFLAYVAYDLWKTDKDLNDKK
jgi:hypothetical protein